MGTIARLYDFVAGTRIRSAQIDAELDSLVLAHNTMDIDINTLITAGTLSQIDLGLIDISRPPVSLTAVVPNGVTDNRLLIQNIIDYASSNKYKGVYIPYSVNSYKINVNHMGINQHLGNGLQIPSNFDFIMHPDTILEALPTTYSYQVMLNVHDADSVKISGGTIKGERASHGVAVNEFGYGVYIHGSTNVKVANLTSKDFWGDSFTLRDIDTNPANSFLQPCQNIVFDNVIADNACRNGMSVVSGKNVRILNSTFKNTNGTAPAAGIDCEPNYPDTAKRLQNIIIDNCTFSNNAVFSLVASKTTNLNVNNCVINDSSMSILSTVTDVIITKNKFTAATCSGLAQNATVRDNIIRDAIYGLDWGNTTNDITLIEGNKVYNCHRGISLNGGNKNIIFQGNVIYGSTEYGILMASGTCDGISYIDNTFQNNAGYHHFSLINSFISNNRFIDCAFHLWMAGGNGSVIQNNSFRIVTNPFSSTNFLTIASTVTGVILDGNRFYATSSDSVAVISITANAGRAVPIIMRNNVSMKTTTVFTSPPAGVLSANNYSA